jgi:hypothetical protein
MEIVETESRFFADMTILKQVYATPAIEKGILNSGDHKILFGNLDLVIETSEKMVEKLDEAVRDAGDAAIDGEGASGGGWIRPPRVGKVFLDMVSFDFLQFNPFRQNPDPPIVCCVPLDARDRENIHLVLQISRTNSHQADRVLITGMPANNPTISERISIETSRVKSARFNGCMGSFGFGYKTCTESVEVPVADKNIDKGNTDAPWPFKATTRTGTR